MGFENGQIEKRVLIQASPAIVFKALTEARDLVRWFCDRASSDVREGGEITAFWKSDKAGTKGRGIFTRLLPGALVEITWKDEGGGPVEDAKHIFSRPCILNKPFIGYHMHIFEKYMKLRKYRFECFFIFLFKL